MILCHKAHDSGELLERPLTDKYIFLGRTSWHHDAMSKPDQMFEKAQVLSFFDGKHHKSVFRTRRDIEIDNILEALGWKVLRFPYRRNTKKKRLELLQTIIETVNKKIKGVK